MSSSFHYKAEFSTQNFSGTIRTEDIYSIDYSSFTAKQEISMFNICLGYTYKF